MDMTHCINDLAEFRQALADRLQRNVQSVRESDRELTDVENARFEVGTGLLMDLIRDVDGVLDVWRKGSPAYRLTEHMIADAKPLSGAQRSVLALLADGWEIVWDRSGEGYGCAAYRAGSRQAVAPRTLQALERRGRITLEKHGNFSVRAKKIDKEAIAT